MIKLVTVVGARPQFIKASVVSAEFAKHRDIAEVLVHTGQHFDTNMSDVFFAELGMPTPAYHLNIHGGRHGAMTGRMLAGIENVLLSEKPDLVLVYGDTNSTIAGALSAAKLRIPVAHVEAGLRSFNMGMPEEINRILTDRIANWLFAPTDIAVENLTQEGTDPAHVYHVGDVMYDVALHHGKRAQHLKSGALARFGLAPKQYVLTTVHRAENTDDPARIKIIVEALTEVGNRMPVLWPMHPRTREVLRNSGDLPALARVVQITEPVGYLEMVQLERCASVIATDSGGVQKEAFFHQVPCVTLRDETEWVELVKAGWNRVLPPRSKQSVTTAILEAAGSRGNIVQPYGNGDSAARIYASLIAGAA